MLNSLGRREFLLASFPFVWRPKPFVTLDHIRFEVIRNHRSPHRYLLIHGNEETAREVLQDHMRRYTGKAHLVAGHERNVEIEGAQLDPNRMFSREGAEKNLHRLNPELSQERIDHVLDLLDRGREEMLEHLFPPPDGRLVALHNNSEGYSMKGEIAISDDVSLGQPDQPHEFFLCTWQDDFIALAKSPYNVLWQWRAPQEDDGSLSRLAAQRGVRYINLEVALGQRQKQIEMMNWLEKNLR